VYFLVSSPTMNVEAKLNGSHVPSAAKADSFLQDASSEYIHANPKSRAIAADAASYFPGGSTRASLQMTPFTLTFASGEKSTLTDVDGHTYNDFLGEYTAGIFGHSNPNIKAAIHAAIDNGWNFGGHSVYEAELAKRVCQRFQPTMERVRFTNSGTEANTFAIATALAHFRDHQPQRRRIMVFDGGYHGGTFKFPKLATGSDDPMNLPHDFVVAPFDDISGTTALLQSSALDLSSTLATVLVEPMQGNAGARPASTTFLSFLREQCNQLGAILIFDEVQTSRLGPHGLGAKLGIRPDLMSVGKWVGGGMTFGAFGGREDLMEQFGRGGKLAHAGTFNNNVVSMAAGCAGLEILTAGVLEGLNARGERLRKELARTLVRLEGPTTNDASSTSSASNGHHHQSPVFVTGVGSILSINFREPRADTLRSLFWHAMLRAGIYLSPRGFVALSIEVTDEQIDGFVRAVEGWVDWYIAHA
jgi:glutamate-1-semialdehyde 2,1-aminomutase